MGMTFKHRGELWHRSDATALDRFIVGVDLGQSVDPTAIAVLHHRIEPLNTWTEIRGASGTNVLRQDRDERFDVRHLERLPLGQPYPVVVQHVAGLLGRPPLHHACDLVIDETGVGRAVGDMFDGADMRPHRITITAGNEATDHGDRSWHVPKTVLISTIDARLHTGELRFAAELSEAAAMAEELKDFRRNVSAAGRATYSARANKHDDLVLAVAIAVWFATKPSNGESSTGFTRGLW